MKERSFTEEIDTYHVLILDLDDYLPSKRILPDGFALADRRDQESYRKQEKVLLRRLFDDWYIPYYRELKGWRSDSPLFVVRGEQLIGGVYLCGGNEFNDDPGRGQLHYAFVDPVFKGLGIYSVIFLEAVERARQWNLTTLYLNSDRYLLPEVYIRWGAKPWKKIRKKSYLPRNRLGYLVRKLLSPVRFVYRFLR